MDYRIFPQPFKIKYERETASFENAEWILIQFNAGHNIRKHICEFASKTSLKVSAGVPRKGKSFLMTELKKGFPPDGYEICINRNGISLTASDERGIFYGLQALSQIIIKYGMKLRCCVITDRPDFKKRGVMLDVSRCKVPSMQTMQNYIDTLAKLKINQLQLYMEHTFAFSEHETVWHEASPFTAEEIILLDAYCAERYIELIPNFNSFGHFERWLRHPEYKHLAECPDGYERSTGIRSPWGSTLKPCKNTLKFLGNLYSEFMPNFRSGYFNAGCDETWDLGLGWSKKICDKKGKTKVYLDFLTEIHKLVRKHRKRMMFWGDIILHQPELIKKLPKEITALNWGYEAAHPFSKECPQFASSGIPFYVCPGTSSWNSLTGRTANCTENLRNAAENGLKYGAEGFLNTDWGDNGHHQYLPVSYLGVLAGASYSWSYKTNKNIDLLQGLNNIFFDDETGLTGKLFFNLGKVLENIKARPKNCTVFNKFFFWNMKDGKEDFLKDIDIPSLNRCLSDFEEIESQISAAAPGVEGELVKAELSNAVRMAKLSVLKIVALMKKKKDYLPLKHEMETIIREHENLWPARNRIGGLRESSGKIREALSALEIMK
ncbi:MAG: hypothetical protein A2017_07425 [Lentisphaerae bacterium GWF2_44_16]|nr:MAG: hypothetical protein A2017_07425 [Lentisphaerae bacterium GWF2_44_16]